MGRKPHNRRAALSSSILAEYADWEIVDMVMKRLIEELDEFGPIGADTNFSRELTKFAMQLMDRIVQPVQENDKR